MIKIVDLVWVVVFSIAPIYPVVISIAYRQGRLAEEVRFLRDIILKYVKLNGFKKE